MRLWQLALAVLAGNLSLQQLPQLPAPLVLLGLSVAALAGLARAGATLPSLLAVAALSFCWTGAVASQGLQSRWPLAADGEDLALRGWIDAVPRRDAGRTVFSLKLSAAPQAGAPRRVRLSWYDPAPALAAGDELELVARLRSPRGLANPGGFDYERWLFLEGYDATGYVRSGERLADSGTGFARRWLKLRTQLAERIAAQLADADASALILALSLGDRRLFTDRHWQTLQRTGTSHLVAVSGLHIGLIAAFAYWLVLRLALHLPYRLARHAHALAAGGCVLPAAGYAALSGFALPTQRALLMLLVAQALVLARGRWPLGAGLSLAAIAVLLLDPLASLTASFWLSFGAVVLILATAAPRAARRPSLAARLKRDLGALCRLQWGLGLGLVPIVLWHFGVLAPASLVVNLVAIPLFSLVVLPLSLLGAGAAALAPGGNGLVAAAELAAGRAWQLLELAAASPHAAFALPRPSPAASGLALIAVAASLMRHGLPRPQLALVGLLPLVVSGRAAPAPGEARIDVLDVGHGLAVAVTTASHRLLYDAGPVYRSGFDAGQEIVAPALAAIGSRGLDLLLLSHGDSDHAGGADAILERYPGVRLLAGPDIESSRAETCGSGQEWFWDGVVFAVLHPPAGFRPQGNESSCVLRIETAGAVVLLTGDIEGRAEARLARDPRLAADIVVVPHHGSLTSSSVAFVRRVAPKLAIVSAGFNNRWGFPRAEVRARWEAVGAGLLVTGEVGAIELKLQAGGIEITAARDRKRRYWQPKREPVSGAIDAGAL